MSSKDHEGGPDHVEDPVIADGAAAESGKRLSCGNDFANLTVTGKLEKLERWMLRNTVARRH